MENQKKEQQTNQQQVKNSMAYIPAVAFVLYFTEQTKSVQFLRHIRYGMILFWIFIVFSIFFRSIFLGMLFLIYIWISAYLWYKAYIWEDVNFSFIDNFFEKSKENKKEEIEEEIEEEEIDILK